MSMNLWKSNGENGQPSTFEDVITALGKALEVVKHKRTASKKARLRLIQIAADRAEGKRLDMSRDQHKTQAGFEQALEEAFAAGGLDAVEIEIEERRLTVRRLAAIVPVERAREAEAQEELNAARAKQEAARGRAHSVASRLGEEQAKLEVLEKERTAYQRLCENISRGEHPKLWQGAGDPPQHSEFVPYTWHDFTRQYYKDGMLGYHDVAEGRVQRADLEKRAEEANRLAKEEHEKQYRDVCEIARLRISPRELPLLREDTPKEAA